MNDILSYLTVNNLLFLLVSLVFLWLFIKIVKLFAFLFRNIKLMYFILAFIGFYLLNRIIPQYAINLFACGIFLWCLLDIISDKLNLPKAERYQQSVLPLFALL